MSSLLGGLALHWLGGLASASFYVPYKKVRQWSWEVYWLVGGFVSWIVAPWAFALIQTKDVVDVLSQTSNSTLFYCYLFGVLWGFGGLTFGLTLRYLGLSLGMAVALGFTTVFGTLIPPIYAGIFGNLVSSSAGQVILMGLAVTVSGIVIIALAGHSKESEIDPTLRQTAVAEYDFKKGILVAVFSGIMSASFAFGLAAGDEIRELTVAAGTDPLNKGLPILCVVLLGGFTTNALWCGWLIVKNKRLKEFTGRVVTDGVEQKLTTSLLVSNTFFCALAGLTWYLQFFFYTMGEYKLGENYSFSSWTLHMASIIIFSTLWGVFFKEWSGVSRKTKWLVIFGIGYLVLSTIIIGYGNTL